MRFTRLISAAMLVGAAIAAQAASPMPWDSGGLPRVGWASDGQDIIPSPPSTRANHGYLPTGQVSAAPSMPVDSYTARVRPNRVGVQFLAARPASLRAAGVSITVTPPGGRAVVYHPHVTEDGLVVWAPSGGWTTGRWHFRVGSRVLGYTNTWAVTLDGHTTDLRRTDRPQSANQALLILNGVRKELGLAPVDWASRLALAAGWHAAYLARYGPNHPSFHVEQPGAGFTGTMPWNRDLAAGWPDGDTGEVGMTAPTAIDGGAVVAALLDTVYHRVALLAGKLTRFGQGQATGAVTAATIDDLGYQYPAGLRLAVVYPPPGAQGVPRGWLDNETPDPVPHGAGRVYGYPVTADFPTVSQLGASRMLLLNHGRLVAAFNDPPGSGDLAANQMALVPRRVLAPDTTYTVVLTCPDALMEDGRREALADRWQFRTSRGDQSVYAAFDGQIVAAVDDAASDMVAAGVPVLVQVAYGGDGPSGRRWRVERRATAVTEPDGLAAISLGVERGGWYRAQLTTASGGRGRVTWHVGR